ncbi:hypothetical protein Shyd_53950 [Streptomyces hydrogenans]|uniref:Uncharacterized protein n=1 Tax=Streptomyces hydrogenans TaxID=1873719 RepID=A0ABQ3P5L4_9ACTN|nr:hypothetical protein GCM10018784_04170 [Streptomyces hydrogenans]GHI20319.1 hypothetical protein Shyd_16900 [Streptomyces hydrogenans]GHI24024.1 hypothetical protein Shyd_53950 [Streptomyces hydrogenans]
MAGREVGKRGERRGGREAAREARRVPRLLFWGPLPRGLSAAGPPRDGPPRGGQRRDDLPRGGLRHDGLRHDGLLRGHSPALSVGSSARSLRRGGGVLSPYSSVLLAGGRNNGCESTVSDVLIFRCRQALPPKR